MYGHFSEQDWLEYLSGTLPQNRAASIRQHVEVCGGCAELFGELTRWHGLITSEGSRLREALVLPREEMDRFVERSVGRICQASPVAVPCGEGRTAVEGMFLLRSLMEPIFGTGTARVAIDLAVHRCTVDPRGELRFGD